MANTDIMVSFSGADVSNLMFLPEKAGVISFARYLGWQGDKGDTNKQPGWRTSFELASWGRHRPFFIRKEFALEMTGLYNWGHSSGMGPVRADKYPGFEEENLEKVKSEDPEIMKQLGGGRIAREEGVLELLRDKTTKELKLEAKERPVFVVKPRRTDGGHAPKINEVYNRFSGLLNRTSHQHARDQRMVKFLHMSDLDKIVGTVVSIVGELDQLYEMEKTEGIEGWEGKRG